MSKNLTKSLRTNIKIYHIRSSLTRPILVISRSSHTRALRPSSGGGLTKPPHDSIRSNSPGLSGLWSSDRATGTCTKSAQGREEICFRRVKIGRDCYQFRSEAVAAGCIQKSAKENVRCRKQERRYIAQTWVNSTENGPEGAWHILLTACCEAAENTVKHLSAG